MRIRECYIDAQSPALGTAVLDQRFRLTCLDAMRIVDGLDCSSVARSNRYESIGERTRDLSDQIARGSALVVSRAHSVREWTGVICGNRKRVLRPTDRPYRGRPVHTERDCDHSVHRRSLCGAVVPVGQAGGIFIDRAVEGAFAPAMGENAGIAQGTET